jgi:hypothetical protein
LVADLAGPELAKLQPFGQWQCRNGDTLLAYKLVEGVKKPLNPIKFTDSNSLKK